MKITRKMVTLMSCITVALAICAIMSGCVNAPALNSDTDLPANLLALVSSEPPSSDMLVTLPEAPQLYLIYVSDSTQARPVRAMQSSTNWTFVYENGEMTDVSTQGTNLWDMNHRGLNDGIVRLSGNDGEIELYFSDNYPPDTIAVQRWTTEHVTGEFGTNDDIYYGAEEIEIIGNRFRVSYYDGHDYIYRLYATWGGNNSIYYFRVVGRMAEDGRGTLTADTQDGRGTLTADTQSSMPQESGPEHSYPPLPFEVGRVTVISGGAVHEPFEHFMHGTVLTEHGMISGLGIPLSLEDVAKTLPVIYHADDFQVFVDGKYATAIGFTWYDSNFEPVYGGEDGFAIVDSGLYMLIVGVEWSNEANVGDREFTFTRYIFMVMM